MFDDSWCTVKDGDPRAFALMRRHYSYQDYKDNRRRDLSYRNRCLFVGPGEKMVLMTPDCKALFVWRKFQDDSGQEGVSCAAFRNEGKRLSSELIQEAVELAWLRWPGERLYTYVDPRKIQSSNPGYCYQKAGWRKCGETKVNKLIVLERTTGEVRNG